MKLLLLAAVLLLAGPARAQAPTPPVPAGATLEFVANQLVSSNAEFQPLLRDALRPIQGRLLGPLERIFADTQATAAQRVSAANAFADFAAKDIPKLSQLLAVATPEQYAVLYPLVAASPLPATVADLAKIAATLPPAVCTSTGVEMA